MPCCPSSSPASVAAMKLYFVALAALLGLGVAVGSPYSYEETFRYNSVLVTGVENPEKTYSGSSLRMDVKVWHQAGDDQPAVIQFIRPRTAWFNAIVEEEFPAAEHLPQPLSEEHEVRMLEGQFKAYLGRKQGVVMEVPSNSSLWVNNIRKAVVQMMRIPPIVDVRAGPDPSSNSLRGSPRRLHHLDSYQVQEETYAGLCNASYTVTRDSGDWEKFIDPSQITAPREGDFRLHRSIDFDSCHDKPVMTSKTSLTNYTEAYMSRFREAATRTAHSQYLLREHQEDQNRVQILQAVQMGAHTMRPFGQDMGEQLTLTNQTLTLTSSNLASGASRRPSSNVPNPRTDKTIQTWQHQFATPAREPSDPKDRAPWAYYQGQSDEYSPLYPEYIALGQHPRSEQQNKEILKTLLQRVWQQSETAIHFENSSYEGSIDGNLTHTLHWASRIARALPLNSLQEIYNWVPENQRPETYKIQQYIDILAASGSSAALKLLVEKAKSGQINHARMAGIITTYATNVFDPAAITKELMPYVKSLQYSSDPSAEYSKNYLLIQAHLNFARLAKHACVDPEIKQYAVPHYLLGQKMCSKQQVESDFEPYLRSKYQQASLSMKPMFLESLASLGSEKSIPFLGEVIRGHDSSRQQQPLSVRIAAVYALANHYQRNDTKQKVFRELLPVAESPEQPFELREAAFVSLVLLKPNETFFQRFAQSTWREPVYQMRSLIASTFISLAESRDPHYPIMIGNARKYLSQIRMAQPAYQNAINYVTKSYHHDIGVSVRERRSWIDSYFLRVPANYQYDLKASFGGIKMPIIKAITLSQFEDTEWTRGLKAVLTGSSRRPESPSAAGRNPASRKVQQEIEQLVEELQLETSRSENAEAYFTLINLFNYRTYVPRDHHTMKMIVQNIVRKLPGLVQKGRQPERNNSVFTSKYFNPVDELVMLPTPFGIPVHYEVNAPNMAFWDALYVADASNPMDFLRNIENDVSNYINVTVNGQTKNTMKTESTMTVHMPWANQTAVAGFDTETTVSLPGQFSWTVSQQGIFVHTNMTMSPQFHGQRPLVLVRNLPMSGLQWLSAPASPRTSHWNSIKVAAHERRSGPSFNSTVDLYPWTGLKAYINYTGDVDIPFSYERFLEMTSEPSRLVTLLTTPSKKYYQMAFQYNMDQSETKNITVGFTWQLGSELFRKLRSTEEPSRMSAQQLAEKLNIENPMDRITKFMTNQLPVGDFYMSLTANYTSPQGSRPRQYELTVTGQNKTQPRASSEDTLRQSMVIVTQMKGAEGYENLQKACLSTDIKEQDPRSIQSLSQFQQQDISTQLDTQLLAGQSCSSNERVASAKTVMHVSEEGKRMLISSAKEEELRELERNQPELLGQFFSKYVYDKIGMEIHYQPEQVQDKVKNASRIVFDWMRQASFPNVVANIDESIQAPIQGMLVNITRRVPHRVVDVWVHKAGEIYQVQTLPVSPVLDWLTPLLGGQVSGHKWQHSGSPSSNRRSSLSSAEMSPSKQCVIKPAKVISFDGVEYSKFPSTCEALSMKFRDAENNNDIIIVKTKETSKSQSAPQEVSILLGKMQKKIILKNNDIMINNERMTQKEKKISIPQIEEQVSLFNEPSKKVLVIPGKLKVILEGESTVKVQASNALRNKMKGLCGDNNSEKHFDMMSPKSCKFEPSQGPAFAAIWTTQKSECSESDVRSKIQEAIRIEETRCQKPLQAHWHRRQ